MEVFGIVGGISSGIALLGAFLNETVGDIVFGLFRSKIIIKIKEDPRCAHAIKQKVSGRGAVETAHDGSTRPQYEASNGWYGIIYKKYPIFIHIEEERITLQACFRFKKYLREFLDTLYQDNFAPQRLTTTYNSEVVTSGRIRSSVDLPISKP